MTTPASLKKALHVAGSEFAKHWLSLSVVGVTAVLIAVLRGRVATWLSASTLVPNWGLAGGVVAIALLIAAVGHRLLALWRGRHARYRATVVDTYLGLAWTIKSPPDKWIDTNIKDLIGYQTDRIVEGP